MKKSAKFLPITHDEIIKLFSNIDAKLNRKVSIVAIGGVALILQQVLDRVTRDIDIINSGDALFFQKICSDLGIVVDIVTVSSTVDFGEAPKVQLFKGKQLCVESVLLTDLLKLKLERFRKQDPEDIYAIIGKTNLGYSEFKALVQDMLPDFIGNQRELLLSAWLVVDRMYPSHSADFKAILD